MAAAKRFENESFVNYRIRLKQMAEKEKQDAKGKMFWDSSRRGTYVK